MSGTDFLATFRELGYTSTFMAAWAAEIGKVSEQNLFPNTQTKVFYHFLDCFPNFLIFLRALCKSGFPKEYLFTILFFCSPANI